MSDLFIADLHLDRQNPTRQTFFARFIDEMIIPRHDRLYILGDLFNYWIGRDHLKKDDYRIALDAIARATAAGCEVTYVIGNRDMHVQQEFSKSLGVTLHRWSGSVQLGRRNVHLSHGDLLCTADVKHLLINSALRSPLAASMFTALPERLKYQMAEGYSNLSDITKPQAREHTTYIRIEALERLFKKGFDTIICGHVHGKSHRLFTSQKTGRVHEVFSLEEWLDDGPYLEFDGDAFHHRVFR